MLVYFINTLFTLIDCLLMAYIYKKSAPTQSTNKWIILVLICFILKYALFIFIPENLFIKEFINLIFSFIIYLCVGILMKVEKSSIMLWAFVFLSIVMISENLAQLTQLGTAREPWFTDSVPSLIPYLNLSLFSSILKIILLYIIFLIFFQNHLKQIPKLPNKLILILCVVPISSITILFTTRLWWYNRIVLSVIGLLGIDFGVITITMANLLIFKFIQIHILELSHKKRREIIAKNNSQYLNDLETKEKRIRTMHHDLKNQYLILASYIENHNEKAALNYINKSIITLDQSLIDFYTSNPSINYLLNQKAQQARDNNIKMAIETFIPNNFYIGNTIITSILGNLLDNALYACIRQKNLEKKMNVSLKLFNNNLIINIDNTFDPSEIRSRKWRIRKGIGLKIVQTIVEEQNGLYRHWIEDGIYHASVILMNIYGEEEKE